MVRIEKGGGVGGGWEVAYTFGKWPSLPTKGHDHGFDTSSKNGTGAGRKQRCIHTGRNPFDCTKGNASRRRVHKLGNI